VRLQDELFAVLDALGQAGLRYALCGGFAVIVHGYPRLTTDIDLLVQEDELEAVRSVLARLGYTVDSGWVTFRQGTALEARLRRVAKVEGAELLTLDLFVVGPFLAEVWAGREWDAIGERRVCVVSRAGLLKMKRAADRHKDRDDIEQLRLEEDDVGRR
jgi:hypothetical protein